MRIDRVSMLAILCLTMFPLPGHAFRITLGNLTPVVTAVTPDRTAPYEIVTVEGFGLGASMVRNVYLMDAKGDYSVDVLEQTDRLLRFRVPGKVPPGRKRLVLELTNRSEASDRSRLEETDFYVDVDPVQLRDVPPAYPTLPTDLKRNPLYQLAAV